MRILAGILVDGSGNRVRKGMVIQTRNGCIDKVFPFEGGPWNGDADLSGYTVMPLLVDAHVHLFMSSFADPEKRRRQLDADFEEARPKMVAHLAAHLKYGVGMVRDGGDKMGHALSLKESGCANSVRAEFRAAGKAWRAKGRYGRLIGRPPKPGQTLARAVAQDETPKDHVKIVNSGLNSLKEFGRLTPAQFSLEELTAAVLAANEKGLPVMVHANGPQGVQTAVDAGCASIEHGFFMGRKCLEKMAARRTVWVPTACTMKGYADTLDPHAPEAEIARQNLDSQIQQMDLARQIGVKMAAGTDAGTLGVAHGPGMVMELELMTRAGCTPEQAVANAADVGARLLGLKNRGRIAPGYEAVFVAARGYLSRFPGFLEGCRIIRANGRGESA